MLSIIGTAARYIEDRIFPKLGIFGAVSGVILVAMMLIIVVDAVGRRFFGHPVYCAHETISWLLSLLVFFSICYTAIKKAHLEIDIIISHFRPSISGVIITILYFISAIISWILSSQLIVYGIAKKASGATGIELTFLPIYPLIYAAAFGTIVLGFIFLIRSISTLSEAITNE